MRLPAAVRRAVEARFGPIRANRAVGGGCVSPALRLDLADRAAFLKWDEEGHAGLFPAEARGLARLLAAGAGAGIRVPEVLALEDAGAKADTAPGWLLLEWLEPAATGADFGERLGRGLAAVHRTRGANWGGEADGFIGPLPQSNATAPDWAGFWRERRLAPQLERARQAGQDVGATTDWDRLFERLPGLLAPAEREGPSLLHGDLWSGNLLSVRPAPESATPGGGEPALIDPSAYFGHREVDLAMSELFGGFPSSFHAAYRESWPLEPGYSERRTVYQLYYLLVHVNLFGGGYARQTARALREALG